MKDIVIQRLTDNGYDKKTVMRIAYLLKAICNFQKTRDSRLYAGVRTKVLSPGFHSLVIDE